MPRAAPQPGRRPWWLSWWLIAAVALVPLVLGLFFVYALLGLFIVGGLFGALASFHQAREFADTPTSKIRSAAQGYVELVARGSATDADGSPLLSPLTGTPCCYWQLEAERYVETSKNGNWRREAFTRWPRDVLPVEDGTGTCYVAVADADIHARHEVTRRVGSEELAALADRFGPQARERLERPGRWRLREILLPADADLYAIGRFESFRSDETPYDENWATKALQAGDAAPAWARSLARLALEQSAAEREAAAERWRKLMRRLEGIGPEAPLSGGAIAHTLGKDWTRGSSKPLILSDRPERWLVRRYYIYALSGLAVAVVMTLVLAGFLLKDRPETLAMVLQWLGLPPP